MTWTKGASVEVKGAEAGFDNSWWPATVVAEKPGKHLEVKYKTLIAKEGGKKYLQELVASKMLRPAAHDDSKTTKLSKRRVGEAVDCWWEGGWWTGYVHKTEDDQISVYFPLFQDEEPMVVRAGAPADEDAPRVRTALQYDDRSGEWSKLLAQTYPGCGDYRSIPGAGQVVAKRSKPVQKRTAAKRQKPTAASRAKR